MIEEELGRGGFISRESIRNVKNEDVTNRGKKASYCNSTFNLSFSNQRAILLLSEITKPLHSPIDKNDKLPRDISSVLPEAGKQLMLLSFRHMISAVALQGGAMGGRAPPPHFGLLKMLFLEHHATTRQKTMMEEGIITFKPNSRLTFSRFFVKLLATNCCT